MRSNASSGAGTLSVIAGSTSIASVSPTAAFNSASWYGAWSTTYVNITKTPSAYTIGTGENVVIQIAATTNSIYIQSYTIVYVDVPTCTDPGLAFGVSTVTKNDTDLNFTEIATSTSAGAITYSSSNTGVATVNSTTGEVDIFGAGTATITATQVTNSTYCADTATYSLTVNSTSPTITLAATAITTMTTTYGTASANQCFTFTAANLTGSVVTVTAPSGFQVATSSGGTYAASQTYTITSGSASGTVCVRLANNTAVGTYSGNITLSDGTTSAIKAIPNSTVNPKALTITGLSATSKVYDGNTIVVISGTPAYSGLVLGETFTVAGSVTWAFNTENVGATVTRTGNYNVPSANYTVTQPSLTASITPKALTVSGATAQNKVYDGNTTAVITGATLVGVVSPDVVTVSGGGTFASANVGTGISVTPSLSIAGEDAGNYTLTQPIGLSANITKADPVFTTSTITINVAGTYALPGANVVTTSDGALSYTISAGGFATLTGSTINGVVVGSETLTVNQAASANYNAGSTTVTVIVSACSPPFWEENFDYGGCDIVDISTNTAFMTNWAFHSDGPDPLRYNTTSLSYSGYASSGIGGSGQYQGGADDDFKREISGASGVSSGALYTSFMVNMTGAGTLDYFFSFMDNINGFYGRVHMRSSGAGYQLGITKFIGAIVWNAPVLSFNSTYLIVVKNEFVAGGVNDVLKMWIIPSGVPASEALAGVPTITAVTADTDPSTSIRYIGIRETGKEVGFIDGIRVATSWESLFCGSIPTATTYNWTGASSSSWATAGNWSPSGVPSSIDNIVISSTGSNMLNITDCRSVKDFILSGTGAFTTSATGVFTINGNVSYTSSVSSTLDCDSQVYIKSTAPQLVPPLTYGNLDVLGGNRVLSPTGVIKICSAFNVNPVTHTYTVTGSTVEYISPLSVWEMAQFTYNNLIFSGVGVFSIGLSGTNANKTINVLGNFMQTNGTVRLGDNASATASLNVDGDMTISGGTFDLNKLSGGTGILNLKGDLSVSATAQLTGTFLNGRVNFTGTGDGSSEVLTQSIDIKNTNSAYFTAFNISSGFTKLISQDLHLATNSSFTVKNGAIFNFGFATDDITPLHIVSVTLPTLRIGQTFITEAGSTIKITSPYGITTAAAAATSGNVQTPVAGRTFNVGVTYHYIGKANALSPNQVSGNGLPNGITGKVIIELDTDAIILKASGNKTFNTAGTLEIRKGIVEDVSTDSFGDAASNTGNLTMTGGRYRIYKGSTQPDLSGTYTLTAGVVEFAGTLAKTIRSPKTYQNIEVTGNNVGNSSGNITLNADGTFTVKNNGVATPAAGIFTINDNAIVGPIGTQTVSIENGALFKTGDVDGFNGGTGATTTSLRSDIETISLANGSTVEYSRATGTGNQIITLFSPAYRNLTISGIGVKTLQSTLDTKVDEDLKVDAAKLLVETGKAITVKEAVLIAASGAEFEINNNASLVQINNVANSGNITYKRIAQQRRSDYVYWSSPVDNFNISSHPSDGSKYHWNTLSANPNLYQGNWQAASGIMNTGKGYIVSGPSSFNNTANQDLEVPFFGVPRNGNISITINRGSNTTPITILPPPAGTVTNLDDNWNLLGNPYPSAINCRDFLTLNNSVLTGAVYIWRHGTLPSSSIGNPFYDNFGANYNPNDYIPYNLTGFLANTYPDYYIGAGQGFFVTMSDGPTGSATVNFNNSLRNSAYGNVTGTNFFRPSTLTETENPEFNRIWLDLIKNNESTRTLLGYVTGATMGKDNLHDAISKYDNSSKIYSLINEERFVIQGRSLPFNDMDQVKIGIDITENGQYTIAIAMVDGLFLNTTQNIFLEDKVLNIIHNLRQSPYTFTATNGIYTERFVLRYTNGSALDNPDFETLNNSIIVSTNNGELSIKSLIENIQNVTVFDILGRQLYEAKGISNKELTASNISKSQQALIVKIKLVSGTIVTRKIILW